MTDPKVAKAISKNLADPEAVFDVQWEDGTSGKIAVLPSGDPNVTLPIKDYCDALEQWLDLIVAKVAETPVRTSSYTKPDGTVHEYEVDDVRQLRSIAAAASDLKLAIRKSNYLYRRIYKGEPHRTVKCPVHQGRWSGCTFERIECGCQSDVNVTGWLP